MNNKTVAIGILSLALLSAAAACLIHTRADDKPPADDTPSPTDTVSTAPIKQGDLSQTIVAYGSVTAQPGEIAVFSVPYECRVSRIDVTAGQPLDKQTPLIEIQPSPNAKLALAEAQSNLDIANKNLSQSQQSFGMKLATNAELLQSQQAVQLAQLRLDTLKQQGGASDAQSLTAASPGLVARIDVQQGQIIPAGNPLVETIARDQVEVRLGVEPSAIAQLTLGQSVHLFANGSTDPIDGKIRLITQRVNPDTRLIDVFVTPATRDLLLLDCFVRGEITSNTKSALIVPRNAVLPDDDGQTIFTVKDGKAVKHTVTITLQNDQETAIVSNDLHPGDTIVTLGNLELEDGMAVTTSEPFQNEAAGNSAGDAK
jgi:RND family efflux transporter MFP subunit